MAISTRSVNINAPIDRVFNYVANPANMPEIWPSLIEAKNIEMLEQGGYQYDWKYNMAGVKLNGSTRTVEFIKNKKITDQTLKGIDSKFMWTFQHVESETKVTLEVEYSIPVPVLGKLAESIIIRQNEKEGEVLLQNLKTLMER